MDKLRYVFPNFSFSTYIFLFLDFSYLYGYVFGISTIRYLSLSPEPSLLVAHVLGQMSLLSMCPSRNPAEPFRLCGAAACDAEAHFVDLHGGTVNNTYKVNFSPQVSTEIVI